LDDALVISQ
jgi:hypothetical protein